MAVDERKRILNRNRVRKHRQKVKIMKQYEHSVRLEIAKKIYSQNSLTSEDGSIFNFENENENQFNLQYELRVWAIKHRITHMALKDLLFVLNEGGVRSNGGKSLPKDSRTMLRTPANVEIKTLSHGKLWYHGVEKCLHSILTNINHDAVITLDFNFDGVPLYNSSSITFWPILASIRGIYTIVFAYICIFLSFYAFSLHFCNRLLEFPKIPPFAVCIWCGYSKPPVNEYLQPFVAEMQFLMANTISVNGYQIQVEFGLIISDTPARSMIKG